MSIETTAPQPSQAFACGSAGPADQVFAAGS